MKQSWNALLLASLLGLAMPAWADDHQAGEQAVEAAAGAEEAQVVDVSVIGEQVVTVNTGNETVDVAANLVARCTERKVAMEACGGGLKGIACKKGLEMTKYKGLDCPNL